MKNERNGLEIAVIGLSCRFPGAKNKDEFWQNLVNGDESITFFSKDELLNAGVTKEEIENERYVNAKGVIDNIGYFDNNFFGYTAKEAEIMDPQMRLFHECSYEALEDAGYSSDKVDGKIGIYAGAASNVYYQSLSTFTCNTLAEKFAVSQLNDKDYMGSRVAHKLDLKGPSITLSSASATSLVAVDMACQGLLTGKCDMALTGGVRISFPQVNGYIYQEGMIFSSDGHCRAFDAKSSGTVIGEGVGVVVLKRLEEAIEDGDNIYAVIKGSATNNDGAVKVGFTAPTVDGQVDVIKDALFMADVNPEDISYIETHGTGTLLGDPIEIEALSRSFNTSSKGYCPIGTVKSNIGHLDAAAGIAGLIKTVLSLKNEKIPKSLHYEKSNPNINFEQTPFYVNNTLTDWKRNDKKRFAGVSSFGIGGANAHVILEEAPQVDSDEPNKNYYILNFSGKTKEAVVHQKMNLMNYLINNDKVNIADIAYTLQIGRKEFDFRDFITCNNVSEVIEKLDNHTKNILQKNTNRNKVTFMFPGQGSQYINMALELYNKESLFREELDYCFEVLNNKMGLNMREIIFPSIDKNEINIYNTNIAQPLLFSFEYALAKMLINMDIIPESLIGHSLGEYVAACIAGVFSFEEGLDLVIARGKLMKTTSKGAMTSVLLSENEIQEFIKDTNLEIASVNGESMCVPSGTESEIEKLETELSKKSISYRRLHTSHAFHSKHMETIVDDFRYILSKTNFSKPRIPFISNLTGTWIKEEEATSVEYWISHLRRTVRFHDGIRVLLNESARVFVEVGSGNVLSSFVNKSQFKKDTHFLVNVLKNPRETVSDSLHFYNQLGKLWSIGLKINWEKLYSREKRKRISLPTYPFERKFFWAKRSSDNSLLMKNEGIEINKLLRENIQENNTLTPVEDIAPKQDLTENESIIMKHWKDYLGFNKIGITDNYFELGGDSLGASIILTRIHKETGTLIHLQQMFNSPTIQQLAGLLDNAKGSVAINIKKAVKKDYYQLSSTQRRFFELNSLKGIDTAFNMPSIMRIEGMLDVDKVEKLFKKLIERHETLRTSIVLKNNEPMQLIHKNEEVNFKIERYEATENELDDIVRRFVRSFDLNSFPLIRVGIVKFSPEKFLWLFDAHLIILDYKSRRLLYDEFIKLYKGELLPKLNLQYKDFSEWQNSTFNSGVIKKEETYWTDEYKEIIPPLNMPTDMPRKNISNYETEVIRFNISKEMTDRLSIYTKKNNLTNYIVFFSLYSVLINNYTNQDEIILWSGVAGRSHADVESSIGSFAYSVPIKNKINRKSTISENFEYVKNIMLGVYDHQNYPIEKIFDDFEHELKDSMLSLVNQSDSLIDFSIPNLHFEDCKYINKIKDRDFRLTVELTKKGDYFCFLRYNKDIFRHDTMENFVAEFMMLIDIALKNPNIKIEDITIK